MFRIRKGRSNDYDSFHFEAKHEGSIGWSKGEIVVYRRERKRARRPISGGERRSGPMRIKRTDGKEWNSWMEKRTSGGNKGEQRDRSFWPPWIFVKALQLPSPPQDVDESPFESSILLLCAASIRACSLLAATVSLRNSEGKVFHPPTLRCETETPTFARAGEDNWIPTKLETVVSRLSRVFGNGILALEFKLTFLHAPHESLQSYAQLWQFFFHSLFFSLVSTWLQICFTFELNNSKWMNI